MPHLYTNPVNFCATKININAFIIIMKDVFKLNFTEQNANWRTIQFYIEI